MDGSNKPNTARKAWLSTLAKAPARHVAELWEKAGYAPEHEILRAPEIGAVMMRGRSGAVGAPFNLGEMTVTRCSVRLSSGEVGHGYVQGRDKAHATRAALTDALMQTAHAADINAAIITPLQKAGEGRRTTRAAKAAATKVDFFTMVRGED